MSAKRLLISKRNSAYQVLESLRSNRQKRHHTRTFLLEGVLPINMALAHGWRFQALVHESGAALSAWAQDAMARADADRLEVAPDLFRPLSAKDNPSELLAVVQMPDAGLDRIPMEPNLLVVVVDRPGSPGNLGTLIRSCDAFGAHGVIVAGHGVDIYDPATITASRGSLFAIPVVHVSSPDDIARWLDDVRRVLGSCRMVGTDEAGAIDVSDYDLVPPTVVLLGNETHGMSHAYRHMCDALVRIPMVGSASSLNVSVAASIVLYDALRQRHHHAQSRTSVPGMAGAAPQQ